MGNVIKGEFGGNQKNVEITSPDVIRAEHFDLMNELLKSGAIERLMRLSFSPTTFREAQEKVSGYTTQQLFDEIQRYTESYWGKNPAFFRAVFWR